MTTMSGSDRKGTGALRVVHLFAHTFGFGAGGVEQYGVALATALIQADWKVVFHARQAEAGLAEKVGVILRLHPVVRFPRKLRDFRFFRIISRLAPTLEGVQLALTRVPVRDGAICGGTHRGYLASRRRVGGPFDWLQIWMETQAYRSARHTLPASFLCQRELMERYAMPASKIRVLHPAVRDEFLEVPAAPDRAALRRRLGLPAEAVVFLFPSGSHKRKGLYPILRAAATLQGEAVVAVTGRRPKGVGSAPVVPLGYVDRLADAYLAADFTTLGSYYEPFGQIGPESVLCGTPLVFEERIGCLEVVRPLAVTTFKVRNPASITAALQRAVGLARAGGHRISEPAAMLDYEPSMARQAATLMELLRPSVESEPRPLAGDPDP